MMIIGCDFHPSWQQVSWLDTETGEVGGRKLVHASGDARQFYEQLAAPVLIGMEATGNSQWFVELVEDLGHEIWIGDAAQIRASYVRKQKTDKRDAAHILKLVVEGRFPRLWSPDREQRDLRQLVLHRHKLVEIRSRVKNELAGGPDAGTHPFAFDGTRGRNSLDRDAGVEAAHGPRFVAPTQTEAAAPTQLVWRRASAQSILAGTLLRFQRPDHEEAGGEAAVHALQPGETGTGGNA
jgi:hypothetical protein